MAAWRSMQDGRIFAIWFPSLLPWCPHLLVRALHRVGFVANAGSMSGFGMSLAHVVLQFLHTDLDLEGYHVCKFADHDQNLQFQTITSCMDGDQGLAWQRKGDMSLMVTLSGCCISTPCCHSLGIPQAIHLSVGQATGRGACQSSWGQEGCIAL